jgi:hypothetical protein
MKIQCSCGAKHLFDLTPEMVQRPVSFVCPRCGLDASAFVDGLVRQELGQTATPDGEPVKVDISASEFTPTQAAPPAPPAASEPPRPRASVVARVHTPAAATPVAAAAIAGTPCLKHPGEVALEKCYVCSKPICPKCMELFGYVCSPLCKAKADSHGLNIPVYALQRSVIEARQWRKVVRISWAAGSLLVLFLGLWIWYAWFGQVPRPVFSVRFPEPSYSGQSAFCGPNSSQIVFLHGATLARYDLKTGKEIWSTELVDRKKVAEDVEREIKSMQEHNVRLSDNGMIDVPRVPSQEKLMKELFNSAAAELALHVRGQNVWVSQNDKLVLHDWDSGRPLKELTVKQGYGGIVQRENELLVINTDSGKPVMTRVNLATSEVTTEALSTGALAAVSGEGGASGGSAKKPVELAGLPMGRPGKDAGRPMDPAKVAEQAQHLSFPARVALPAVLAGTMNQERALAEMSDSGPGGAGQDEEAPGGSVSLIPTQDGLLQFTVKLLEARRVERSAMKAAPGKSALDGEVSVGKSLEAASELLNEMQRSRGGDKVVEDLSRYRVSLRRPGATEGWTGEVIGRPTIYPLRTVNVVAANKQIIVVDKTGKKLWQSALNYNVEGGMGALEEETAMYGQGPCVERRDGLYVFDEGVLTAFDLSSGNVRWRLPSVGIVGLFFDEKGMIYVNTSSADPDSIKYSRQIDISKRVSSVVMKVDSRNGKVIWTAEPGGLLNHVDGKIMLVVQYFQPADPPEDGPSVDTGFEPNPYLRIKRINPRNGTEMWEHFQQRSPLDIAFDKTTIRLVFKKEVQVLKFRTL